MAVKVIRLVCSIVITILLLSACSRQHKKYVVGVSQCSEDIWRDKLNEELKTGEYLNDSIMVKLASSNDDNKKQVAQINRFVDEGVDLLIVSPNQLSTISKAIDRAYDKGIPVILYDRKTNSNKYTAFIGCDNYAIGHAMGAFIAQKLGGHGKVVEIRGLEGSSPAIERHRGFTDAMKEHTGMKIVDSEAGDWKEESAIKAMKRILKKTTDFDYVFAHNDRMAWGAYIAAKQTGRERHYHYTGVDALATEGGGLELVRDGVLEATYLYPTKGDEVMALAMDILAHRPYERDNYLQTSIVTHDNAELTLMEAKESDRQKHNLGVLHKQVDQYLADYNSQRMFTIILVLFVAVLIVAAVLIFRGYLVKTRLSEQLASKNKELERLNQEVMELTHSRLVFFTNISHELRTPLTLILDPVEMLLEDGNIKGKSHELLKTVRRNALSLQQLVDSILDFRKIQNGKMTLTLSHMDIVDTLQQWVGDFMLTAQRKKIQLHIDFSSYTAPRTVVADKEKLARIVFNLLSNALKYTPQDGHIYVSLNDAENDQMTLRVRDTGRGIDKEEISHVFERFFQSRGAASGTGIGLALVKSYTELHHGTARVESNDGGGTTFIITMPRMQEGAIDNNEEEKDSKTIHLISDENVLQYVDDGQRTTADMQRLTTNNADRPTLLVVDDNTDIRHYVRTILEDQYVVTEAADGKEALDMARREVPDLVVCDVMMPVMDGLQLCEALKTDNATSHIPVIMLTAKNLDSHRIEGYEHGADSYIVKPFNSKVLLSRIDNLLKQRAALRNAYTKMTTNSGGEADAELNDRDKMFVNQLHDIIHEHMGDSSFSVEDIGSMIGLSRVQLYRKVKAITGASVVELIRKARLAKAKLMLEANAASVSEIAYEVGFSSPSYFTKCFKEEYGMLPGDINATAQGNKSFME